MTTHALVAMDNSEMAERALRFALEHHPSADVTALTVVGEPSSMLGGATTLALEDDVEEAADELAAATLDRARAVAAEYDTDIETEVHVGHPARVILNNADEYDVVVLGSHSGSLADRLFVGNITEKIFRQSPVPVTVVR
ncbi:MULTISPECIES: universal stress protein [Salinibaculum]|uniref:universal stress protein n=1 Tax=Salinibaculum TaxID=2732368 RepID=UPI0030D36ED2